MHTAADPQTQSSRLRPDRLPWLPEDGELLVVAAHPDDEILGAGGLMRAWAARGAKVTVLSVSDGEAADPGRRDLASVRRVELKDALRKLCPTHLSVVRLGLPGGKIAYHLNRLRNAVVSLIRGGVTLIAPYERDGHPDHDAVGKVCVDVARSQRIPIARYAIFARQRAQTEAGTRWGTFPLSADARRAKVRAARCFRSRPELPYVSEIAKPYEAFLL